MTLYDAGIDSADPRFLQRLRSQVELQLNSYSYEIPSGAIGNPISAASLAENLAKMKSCLVDPYWLEVEIRDTFDQIGMEFAPRRNCVVVADSNDGYLLLFDPDENNFVLAQLIGRQTVTIGVRGDAVGCFLAR